MALNATEIAKIGKVAISAYGKNKPIDQLNVERPLLDILLPKAKDLVGGVDGFTLNLYKTNDANGQYYTGNGKVTYNSRSPNEIAKFDWANFHDGFVLNEDELFRAGIAVNDDNGKSTATKGEVVQLTNMLESNFMALEEGAKDFHHAALWLDGSQFTDARPGVDALVSTTPAVGTVGGIDASVTANAYWRNIARTGLGTTLSVLLDALEQSKRDIQRKKGRFTHIFCGAAFYDALRNAVIGANVTQITYGGGSKLSIDMATDTLKFDGIPLTYVPDFDNDFGFAAPTIPWTKRCYMLNLSETGVQMRRAQDDFMKMRYPGRPIDQYTYHFAMTSKFGIGIGKRNTNAVLSIA
jgi:hypothetical protein